MRIRHAIAPVLAALLATACASSNTASAPARAEQADEDKARAQEDARKARIHAEEARLDAQDAERARIEADQRAAYATASAAQTDRDARLEQTGVAESQAPAVEAQYPRVTFATSSADLPGPEQARLDEIAASLRAHPGRRVVIYTYADDTGDSAQDARLAQRRADAVARYFEYRGVSGDRIATKVATREVAYSWRAGDRRGPYRSVVITIR
jgi:outer membrane protein OmpA-like peptidoglycan-associated protein